MTFIKFSRSRAPVPIMIISIKTTTTTTLHYNVHSNINNDAIEASQLILVWHLLQPFNVITLTVKCLVFAHELNKSNLKLNTDIALIIIFKG